MTDSSRELRKLEGENGTVRRHIIATVRMLIDITCSGGVELHVLCCNEEKKCINKRYLCLSKLNGAYFEHKNQIKLSSVLPSMQNTLIAV
jgi:hypothetical protein